MRIVRRVLIGVLALSTIVIAGEPGNQPADKVVTSVMEEFDKAKTDADQKFEKATASFQLTRFKAVERAGKAATIRLEKLQATSKKEGSDLGVEAAKQGIEDVDTAVQNAKLSIIGLDKLVVKFRGHSYLVITRAAKWPDAEKFCKDLDGHLAYAIDNETMKFLQEQFKDSCWCCWIGGTRENGEWLWENGKKIDKSLWENDETRDNPYKKGRAIITQRALQMNGGTDILHPFICEWD
jgi:hypothetical protein